jgi:hypothetical protein
VIGGMISGTILAVLFVPIFFVVIAGMFDRKKDTAAPPEMAPAAEGALHG